jgi:hypothetical protein
MFYRRTRAEMPAAAEEVDAALAEGVEINYLIAPAKVSRSDSTLKFANTRMKLGEPDASGPRQCPSKAANLSPSSIPPGSHRSRPDVPAELKVEVGRGSVVKVDAR